MSDSELLTAEELAEHLKLSAETVKLWSKRERIPRSGYPGRFVFDDVIAAFEASRQSRPKVKATRRRRKRDESVIEFC